MHAIQKFVSDDGIEFMSQSACEDYEALSGRISILINHLIPIPHLSDCSFENGAGYIQQDPAMARSVQIELLKIADELMPHEWFKTAMKNDTAHPSWPARLIDEMGHRNLQMAWHRFSCMTPEFREYGQPYFASHPAEAKDVCLNARSA